jgi:hypothetical protein
MLPVVLMLASLVPTHEAMADSCAYYKWDSVHQTWHRVALLTDEDSFQSTYVYHVDWDCKYCLPLGIRQTDPVVTQATETLSAASAQAGNAVTAVRNVTGTGPTPVTASVSVFTGPECPPVPPEQIPGFM